MEIAAFVALGVAMAVLIVFGILESIAYRKRIKAAQLRDEMQARMNAKMLAIMEAEYPEASCQFDYDSKL